MKRQYLSPLRLAGALLLSGMFLFPACNSDSEDVPGPTGPEVYYLEPAESSDYKVAVFEPLTTKSDQWSFGDYGVQKPVKLDIRKYPKAKRLIFQAEIASTDANVPVSARLYNVTDDRPISGSEITNIWGATRSDNLIGFFPDKEIELTIQVRSTQLGVEAQIWANSFLMVIEE